MYEKTPIIFVILRGKEEKMMEESNENLLKFAQENLAIWINGTSNREVRCQLSKRCYQTN